MREANQIELGTLVRRHLQIVRQKERRRRMTTSSARSSSRSSPNRLGEAMNLVHYKRGWHTMLSLGSMSVAAACARLMRLAKSTDTAVFMVGIP